MKFTFKEKEYEYCTDRTSKSNERTVEVPVAFGYYDSCNGRILEVGNVLSHHRKGLEHDVVDKHEALSGVKNVDIVDYIPDDKYDLILSVSTFEHIGYSEVPGQTEKYYHKVLYAIEYVKNLLKPRGMIVVTFPAGYRPDTQRIISMFDKVYCMMRVSENNEWKQVAVDKGIEAQYGKPFPCANAVFIGEIHEN